ncbi:SMI1/KNR4 family protein [Streptomyces sp. TRM S81-3]|uniref:SMI1/KNR4 family protein n=1 Tax=Streptomyces griseicoloratus TaxID=2752516 RepID=A0A926L9T4_9ACTN|nr:SMI1/KNR4 family protein [Streptomyces griseicoloratus]MBD0424670.1 SMI1/KNR4 family protein [Streptomyces griseicoloratus]
MTGDQKRAEQTLVAWARIETWLKEHAPRTFQGLPAPATEGDVRSLEQELDLTVPADVRAFYLVRNGTGPASDFDWPTSRDAPQPTGYFLPAGEGIGPLENLGLWFEGPVAAERLVDEPGQRYLPITTIDPDGFYGSFVDCTPGQGYGLLGGYAEAELPDPGEWTFAAYLTEVADALCEGRGFGNDTAPNVIDGRLDWQ